MVSSKHTPFVIWHGIGSCNEVHQLTHLIINLYLNQKPWKLDLLSLCNGI